MESESEDTKIKGNESIVAGEVASNEGMNGSSSNQSSIPMMVSNGSQDTELIIAQLQSKIISLEESNAELQKSITSSANRFGREERQAKARENELKSTIDDLRSRLEASQKTQLDGEDKLRQENNTLAEKLRTATRKQSTAQSTLLATQSELDELKRKFNMMLQDFEGMMSDLEKARTELSDTKVSNERISEENNVLKAKLDENETTCREMEQKIKETEEELLPLRQKSQDDVVEIEQLKVKIEELEKAKEDSQIEFRSAHNKILNSTKVLKSELKREKDAREVLENENKALKDDLQRARDSRKEMVNAIEGSSGSGSSSIQPGNDHKTIIALAQRLESLLRENETVREMKRYLEESVQILTKELEKARAELKMVTEIDTRASASGSMSDGEDQMDSFKSKSSKLHPRPTINKGFDENGTSNNEEGDEV